MARVIKRKSTVLIKNNWKIKEAFQFQSGVFTLQYRNLNKRARFNSRNIHIDTRAKKVQVYYEGRGGARKTANPKYTAGWRKMAISMRGKFYK